jgi:4-diphosphocytidyl-2-C-methyl-D-erythritol kinase
MVTAMPWHTVYAPAKINHFLSITGRREDGYHLLQSLMTRIGLYDILHFRPRQDGTIRFLNPQEHVPAEEDLVLRAARALQSATDDSVGVDMLLHKTIPSGAGLGGGSSDAASTLLALNHLWETELSNAELARIGLSLGADIPFFIEGGRSAWVSGIGNVVTPVVTRLPVAYCLMHPPVHVPTPTIFEAPDLRRSDPPRLIEDLDHADERAQWDNALEPTARALFPKLDEYAQAFTVLAHEMKWATPRMTGSGSCFFVPLYEEEWNNPSSITESLGRARDFFEWRAKLEVPRLWIVPQL